MCLQGAKNKGAQRNVAKMSNTKKDEAFANQINVLQSTTQIHRCPGCGKMLALQNRIVLKNTFVINSTSDSQLEVSHNNASEAYD